jgi:acyl-CoA thioester hydrolase
MMKNGQGFRHRVAVRFGEVDQQKVVFNAHYLAYIDDTLENWLRPIRDIEKESGWDMMLKKATIEWQGSLTSGEFLDIDASIARWNRTSWEASFVGTCEGRPVFSALVIYVSVEVDVGTPMETPLKVREFMGEATGADS